MRCFVAIDLSAEVRTAVAAAQARLRIAAPHADVRWTAPHALHLTLKFLGEVPEERRDELTAAFAATVRTHSRFALTVSGRGAFPGLARPRVLWAGVTAGLRELGLLAAAVERAAAELGFPAEARPFRGHVTLGRVRSPQGVGRIARAVEGAAAETFGTWEVAEVVFYRSHLRSTGSEYEVLSRWGLGGG